MQRNPFSWHTIWQHVSPEPNSGCWLWTRVVTPDGYGRVTIGGKKYLTHVLSYFFNCGGKPNGLVLDHLCRNPGCCNPAHLEPVTNRENTLRGNTHGSGWRRDITHCPDGHEYTPENTMRHGTTRKCRACHNARQRKYRKAA